MSNDIATLTLFLSEEQIDGDDDTSQHTSVPINFYLKPYIL